MSNDAPGNPFVDAPGNPFVEKEDKGALGEFVLSSGERYWNNIVPGSGNLLAGLAAGIRGIPGFMMNRDAGFSEKFSEEQQRFPASALRSLTLENVSSGLRSIPALAPGGESPSEALQREKEAYRAERGADVQEHPFAASAGEIAGDIGTLLSMRMPLAKKINAAETRLFSRPDVFFRMTPEKLSDTRWLLDKVAKSNVVQGLARGAGRSFETGVEAMILDAVQGDDPLETVAYAAGGQMAGSALLQGTKGVLSSGGNLGTIGVNIAVAATATGGLWQLMKTVTPGGRDRILESIETGFDKVAVFMILGAAAGVGGYGRVRGSEIAKRFPKVTDAITAIPRAGTLSILNSLVDASQEQQQNAERLMSQLSFDPTVFDEQTLKDIRAAFDDGTFVERAGEFISNAEQFSGELQVQAGRVANSIMQNPSVIRALEAVGLKEKELPKRPSLDEVILSLMDEEGRR